VFLRPAADAGSLFRQFYYNISGSRRQSKNHQKLRNAIMKIANKSLSFCVLSTEAAAQPGMIRTKTDSGRPRCRCCKLLR
jgi:hypothetical protein